MIKCRQDVTDFCLRFDLSVLHPKLQLSTRASGAIKTNVMYRPMYGFPPPHLQMSDAADHSHWLERRAFADAVGLQP